MRVLDLASLYLVTDSEYEVMLGGPGSVASDPDSVLNYLNGATLSMGRYFDDRYPHMEPIHCSVLSGNGTKPLSKEFCLLQMGDTYAYPLFNHFGDYEFIDSEFPVLCDWYSLTSIVFTQRFSLLIVLLFKYYILLCLIVMLCVFVI